jgi:RHS repeat-associated protein
VINVTQTRPSEPRGASTPPPTTATDALTDRLGGPLEYVDTAGVVSGLTHSDPYGVPRPGASGAVGIGFAGEWRDETGLLNLRARSYDPVLGRFIGRDTFGGIASAPQTGNRYVYGLSNPLRYSDPSGHFVNKVLANPVVWATAASIVSPPLGIAWAGVIAATGYDPVSGEHVSGEGRFIAGAAAAFGIVGKIAGAFREAWVATEGIEAAGVAAEGRLAGAFGRAEQRQG